MSTLYSLSLAEDMAADIDAVFFAGLK